MEPLRDALTATHFIFEADQNGQEWWFPCLQGTPNCRETTIHDLPDDQVQCTSINLEHFIKSLSKTKPTVGKEELFAYEEWTRQFGQAGGEANEEDPDLEDDQKEDIAQQQQHQQQQQQQPQQQQQ